MNHANIDKLIEALKQTKKASIFDGAYPETSIDRRFFALDTWFFDCGAPACIAGHACSLAGFDYLDAKLRIIQDEDNVMVRRANFNSLSSEIVNKAAEFLGINHETAMMLFTPDNVSLYDVEPEEAIQVLEGLKDHGEVIWPSAEVDED